MNTINGYSKNILEHFELAKHFFPLENTYLEKTSIAKLSKITWYNFK